MGIKVTSKHCFGSAGCNVGYQVTVLWAGPSPINLDGDYDITYAVTGDESGPIINTIALYANGRYDVPSEEQASTSSSGTDLKVSVTSISKHIG